MNTCSICLRTLLTGNLTGLQCTHVFHSACIAQWEQHSRECPFCRDPIVRHGLRLDFSGIVNVVHNIQEIVEGIVTDMMARPVVEPNRNANQAVQQNEGAIVPNNSNETTVADANGDDMEEILETYYQETVRYESPSDVQMHFLNRSRDGTLNVRLQRRLTTQIDGQIVNGYEAIVWFSNDE